jgi:hypothetical protein
MLPNALFSPLDLHDAIEEAERVSGAAGVVDLLTSALTDPRVRDDSDIDDYLPALKSACRQTRRYREAVPVLRRIAALNPARRHEVAAELAVVHGHLREPTQGVALLESALSAQRRLPVRRRSLAFFVVAEVAAVVLGRPALARAIAAAGHNALPAPPRTRVPVPARTPATAEQSVAVRARGEVPTAVAVRARGEVPTAVGAPGGASFDLVPDPDDAALFDLVPHLGRPTLVLVKDTAA